MEDHLKIIKDKCAQYWNEPRIDIEEVHSILSFIYSKATDAEQRIAELEKQNADLVKAVHDLGEKYIPALEACQAVVEEKDRLYKGTYNNKPMAMCRAVVEKEDDGKGG